MPNSPLWEHDLDGGLRMLGLAVETHVITSHYALPLLIKRPGGLVVEMTDGTKEYNDQNYRVSLLYDHAKNGNSTPTSPRSPARARTPVAARLRPEPGWRP
ncbi:hypothetical protein [Nonomuraea sp. SYSU D8015]|uniref:hypothetical protein n=1 Tax=Nonomuraea sp. SYSU D8015 TaxID=2593644 RepID=UPI003FA5ACEE